MTNKGLSKLAFHLLDRLTDASPVIVPRIFSTTFLGLLGNRLVYTFCQAKYTAILKSVKAFDRILVVADVNVGDAIMNQQSVEVLRAIFPESRIDYACNRISGDLLVALPSADNVFRVFSGNGAPTADDLARLRDIVGSCDYDVVLNFSPFASERDFPGRAPVVRMYVPLASHIIRRWQLKEGRRHISDAMQETLKNLLLPIAKTAGYRIPGRNSSAPLPLPAGNSVYLSGTAIESAQRFLADHHLLQARRMVFFNPDSTSRYTQMPTSLQVQILNRVLEFEEVDAVLLAAGHSHPGIEHELKSAISVSHPEKLVIVPRMSISTYAALIDACDLFLSNDTGPVHIAASWKYDASKTREMRNRTAVVAVFGSGDSKMYGYDSELEGHIPANQRAPSKVFVASAPCRTITCVNKWGKTCGEVRCFDGLSVRTITDFMYTYFTELEARDREAPKRVA